MAITRYVFLLIFASLIPSTGRGQFLYHFNQDIPVGSLESNKEMAWAGGLDLAQYNKVDLNDDGLDDLYIFDRHARKGFCFISDGEKYSYSPEFEHYFPADLEHWVTLRDFNCDGKQDIFTASLFGMRLFENVSEGNGIPSWELKYSTIYTEGGSGQVNLQVNKGDIPGIEDVDGDGDLDILVFNFALGGGVQFHKNMSIERTGVCDLDLVNITERYGEFEECTCVDYIFGTEECPTGGRLEHAGGKSIVSYNYSSGIVQDLVIGQEDCRSYGYLKNVGTEETALMESVSFDFPNSTNPVDLNYPAAFNIDLDFDGVEDLLVTNNMFSDFDDPDFSSNNWFYKRIGSDYSFESTSFFQRSMIDVGFAAVPAFSDLDSDGDEELILGTGSLNGEAHLKLGRNIGDALNPELQFVDDDYLDLSTRGWSKISPQLFDLNQDGREDLVINYNDDQNKMMVFWHTGNSLEPFIDSETQVLETPIIGLNDNPHFYWAGGKLGLLIGRELGRLTLYINQGSINNPIWELISDSYLDIVDDYTALNLAVYVDDLDLDGKDDLIRYDDSGELIIYSDFRNEATEYKELIQNRETLIGYNSSFGRNVRPATTRITGAELPSIALGLVTGGVQLITNIEDEQQEINIPVRISTFPNPLDRAELLQLVVNKDAQIRILNVQGQVYLENLMVNKNQRLQFDLKSFRAGLYLIEAIDSEGGKAVSRFVITN